MPLYSFPTLCSFVLLSLTGCAQAPHLFFVSDSVVLIMLGGVCGAGQLWSPLLMSVTSFFSP